MLIATKLYKNGLLRVVNRNQNKHFFYVRFSVNFSVKAVEIFLTLSTHSPQILNSFTKNLSR